MIFRHIKNFLGCTAILLVLVTAGLACESESVDKPAPVTVTDKNTGESVQLQVGQQLIIRLPGNPSTGFSWAPVTAQGSVLNMDDPSVFEQDQSGGNPPPPGAGGTEVFTFTANTTGQQTLQLEYKRPWEIGIAPATTVSYKVTVK